FQPVMSIAWVVELVASNQSAAKLVPLDQAATSEMKRRPTVPGEPISLTSPLAVKAPLVPTALNVEIAALLRPAALLNEGTAGPPGTATSVPSAGGGPPP